MIRRTSELVDPANLFAFVDEDIGSVDDGHFLVWPGTIMQWANLPADRHNQAGVLSFCDGRVELWRWDAPKRLSPDLYTGGNKSSDPSSLKDLLRLKEVTLQMEADDETLSEQQGRTDQEERIE